MRGKTYSRTIGTRKVVTMCPDVVLEHGAGRRSGLVEHYVGDNSSRDDSAFDCDVARTSRDLHRARTAGVGAHVQTVEHDVLNEEATGNRIDSAATVVLLATEDDPAAGVGDVAAPDRDVRGAAPVAVTLVVDRLEHDRRPDLAVGP